MIKLYIYFETLLLGSLYKLLQFIFRPIKNYLSNINDTAEWYAENNIHIYQFRKAHELYVKQFEEGDEILRKYYEKDSKDE